MTLCGDCEDYDRQCGTCGRWLCATCGQPFSGEPAWTSGEVEHLPPDLRTVYCGSQCQDWAAEAAYGRLYDATGERR